MPYAKADSPKHDRLDDADLLHRTAQGDAVAFRVLHDRHALHALAAARRILGRTPAAEDVTQEALLQLWRSGSRFAPDRGSLRTYLSVLVRSRALDHLRRERVRSETADRAGLASGAAAATAASADEELHRREWRRDVVAGLRGLPREQGEVLGLLYFGDRTQAEVATTLDVPLGTVKGRTRLGLRKLRTQLAPTA